MDLNLIPRTDNSALASLNRPKRLNLVEFEALEVPDAELRARLGIYALEETMHSMPDSVDDQHLDEHGMTPVHRFAHGLYSRELYIPPGKVVVGKRHAIEHLVMITTGRCLCITERGAQELSAPYTFVSPAGEKRVVMTHDDEGCTWVTLHPTTETDLEAIEKDVIIAEPERAEHYKALRKKTKELAMTDFEVLT